MNLRSLFVLGVIAVSTAMPLTVVHMVGVYAENTVAMATLMSREAEFKRLSDLSRDTQSLPPVTASLLLSRHDLASADSLQTKLTTARTDLVAAHADVKASAQRVWGASAVGLICVALTSWGALMWATVSARRQTNNSAVTA